MSSLYTDEILEATTEAFNASYYDGSISESFVAEARELLDAIAPLISSRAAAKALRDFADNDVHFQSAGRMAEDLHAKADEIEGKR